jgi:hypothetical protein
VSGGKVWLNSMDEFTLNLKITGRHLAKASHKIKINNIAEIIEIIDPILAI